MAPLSPAQKERERVRGGERLMERDKEKVREREREGEGEREVNG